jgi:hypothetical protein
MSSNNENNKNSTENDPNEEDLEEDYYGILNVSKEV